MDRCREILQEGLAALALELTEGQIDQLLAFVKLIEKWNKVYNLTAIRQPNEMVRLHILDSLVIVPWLEGSHLIDIGTGAGLPGIPLAICLPEVSITLLDSSMKKIRFVQQAILELNLKNAKVHHGRVEDYQPTQRFDTVMTRAFASLPDMFKLTGHLLADSGVMLAMKGQHFEAELAELTATSQLIPLSVPGVDAKRFVVRIKF